MDTYQHDSATMFRFVLRGELCGESVVDLQHAWITAQSILGTKDLVVDISGIRRADAAGLALLSRMRDLGARLVAALPAESLEFLHAMGIQGRLASPRSRPIVRFWIACRKFFAPRDEAGSKRAEA